MEALSTDAAAPVYGLVARLLLNELDAKLVSLLAADDAAEILDTLVPGFRAYVISFDEEAHEAAAEEFARLFILPGGVPPRAAAWIDGEIETVGAQLSRKTQHYITALGREIDSSVAGKLPLDHLGLLLDLAASSIGTPLQEAVARDLVCPWAHRYGTALSAQARCPVYVAAGLLLQQLAPTA